MSSTIFCLLLFAYSVCWKCVLAILLLIVAFFQQWKQLITMKTCLWRSLRYTQWGQSSGDCNVTFPPRGGLKCNTVEVLHSLLSPEGWQAIVSIEWCIISHNNITYNNIQNSTNNIFKIQTFLLLSNFLIVSCNFYFSLVTSSIINNTINHSIFYNYFTVKFITILFPVTSKTM